MHDAGGPDSMERIGVLDGGFLLSDGSAGLKSCYRENDDLAQVAARG
ncbi:hypothetical protein ABT063_46550 [Streptomyces sp. NPDC002838]